MRQGILSLNADYRSLFSNDLGALVGLLFDIGIGRYAAPPLDDDAAAVAAWEADLARVREEGAKALKAREVERASDHTHTEVQGWLRNLGQALGFEIWIAANDQNRPHGSGRLGDGCLTALPQAIEGAPGAEAVRLIDVLWVEPGSEQAVAAFEKGLFLVAPTGGNALS